MTIDRTNAASDTALINAAQGGDHAAFGELVRRHQAGALRIATIALGSATDAEDVVQEAFVKAHGALGRFREGAAFTPWLYRIVTNTARNRHRRTGRQARLAVRAAGQAPIATDGPDDLAAHQVDRQELLDALGRLRPADRLVLTYRWYEQLTEAEIAEALQCRPGTVKSRLHRAMRRLRTELTNPRENE